MLATMVAASTLEPGQWWSQLMPLLAREEPELVVTDAHPAWPGVIGTQVTGVVHRIPPAEGPCDRLGPDEHFRSVIVIDQLATLGPGRWTALLAQVGRVAALGGRLVVAERLTHVPRPLREWLVEAILEAGFGGVEVHDVAHPECTLITARLRS